MITCKTNQILEKKKIADCFLPKWLAHDPHFLGFFLFFFRLIYQSSQPSLNDDGDGERGTSWGAGASYSWWQSCAPASCIIKMKNCSLKIDIQKDEREREKKKKKRKLLTKYVSLSPDPKQNKKKGKHIFVYLKKQKKTRLFALLEWVTAPTFFHFMRRFWNQILICRSDRQRL